MRRQKGQKQKKSKSIEPSRDLQKRFDKKIEDAVIDIIKEVHASRDRAHKTIAYGVIAALIATLLWWTTMERTQPVPEIERQVHAKIEKADL